jgi:hypothetical protein
MRRRRAIIGTISVLIAASAAASNLGLECRRQSGSTAAKKESAKAVDAIQTALEKEEGEARHRAVESSLRNGLLNPEESVRLEVESYLGHLVERDDFEGLGSVATECLELYGVSEEDPHCAAWFFDDVELARLSVSERSGYYKRAIVDGAVTLWYGSTLWRYSAILKAVNDGITGLEPLIFEYYPTLDDAQGKLLPREEIRPTLELRGGAADRDEACQLGAERLSQRNGEAVLMTLASDTGFREAVIGLVRESCHGACRRTSCDLLRQTLIELQNTVRESLEHRESLANKEELESQSGLVDRLLMYTYRE